MFDKDVKHTLYKCYLSFIQRLRPDVSNYNVEVHAYVKNGKYCVVNNTYEPQDTTVYTTDGNHFDLHLEANEIKWYEI